MSFNVTKLCFSLIFFISFHHYLFYVLLVQCLGICPARKIIKGHRALRRFGKVEIISISHGLCLNGAKT